MGGFDERCAAVLRIVQHDLDAAGYVEFQMRPRNAAVDDEPAVYAALPDGRWWSSGSAMMPDMDDRTMLIRASESVADTLVELLGIVWPACRQHDGPPMSARAGNHGAPIWWCASGAHTVALVGELSVADVVPRLQ